MTTIEWTHRPGTTGCSWNPIRGCSMAKGSEAGGCLNCYAARQAARNLPGHRSPTTGKPFAVMRGAGPRWTGDVEFLPEKLSEPLRWRKPRTVFVNSMSDLFHESLTNEQIAAVFGVMAACPRHTFLTLTKRAERMAEWFQTQEDFVMSLVQRHPDPNMRPVHHWFRAQTIGAAEQLLGGLIVDQDEDSTMIGPWPLPNVWLGISVENQQTADDRIPHLLRCPAAVRWVSYEPALGPVDFTPYIGAQTFRCRCGFHRTEAELAYLGGDKYLCGECNEYCEILPAVRWIVCGGESGPDARPFDVGWARSTVEQCRAAGVACFVKQLGPKPFESRPADGVEKGTESALRRIGTEHPQRPWFRDWTLVHWGNQSRWHRYYRISDPKGGDPSEWPEDLRVREWPG